MVRIWCVLSDTGVTVKRIDTTTNAEVEAEAAAVVAEARGETHVWKKKVPGAGKRCLCEGRYTREEDDKRFENVKINVINSTCDLPNMKT